MSERRKPGRPREYNEDRVTTAVRLPKSLYKRLKIEAIEQETTLNKLVEEATTMYLHSVRGKPARAS
ncbi:MAG TPA: toxin-antitoxin system HicB family antitoxin [Actinomycetota bacterium]|nr:toxin-antitoxin system HicB family antitoxin [Actinomycetota bacterium]